MRMVKNFMKMISRNKWFLVKTLVLVMLLGSVVSLEYKTIVLMLLTFVWRKKIARWCIFSRRRWGRLVARHSWKVLMAVLVVQLWTALPRYRTGSDDRLQLYYLNEQGERVSTPVGHWLFNALLPEEEITNLGVWCARNGIGLAEQFGIGGSIMEQFRNDDARGRIYNFYAPYRELDVRGLSLVSGTTSQAFNNFGIGEKTKSVYVLRPDNYNKEKAYPVVFFCHGYLGNWKLYQGLFAGMDDCFVVSCGTEGLSGIFSHDDINGLLNNIIPMLEREGYKINHEALHLIGLSNGGTACEVAQSSFPNRFKSITYISTGISHTGKTRSTINLIGGGKDPSSSTMYPAYRALKKNGTDANILWYDDESHFVFVNQVSEIMSFIMHDVGAEEAAHRPSSWLKGVDDVMDYFCTGNLLVVFNPFLLIGIMFNLVIWGCVLLLCGIIVFAIMNGLLYLIYQLSARGGRRIRVIRWMVYLQRCVSLTGKGFKWLLRMIKKSLLAWKWYLKRYWLPILFLFVFSIEFYSYYRGISYDWTQWDGFTFHDEKDIGKCLGIDGLPMCHVVKKTFNEYDGHEETVTFDTDDYAQFIKKLSVKADKDTLWKNNMGAIYYNPDRAHTPKGMDRVVFWFDEGSRMFSIRYD